MPRIWFVTGTSRGFGRAFTEAALERGDSVAATARDTSTLDNLVAAHGDRLLPMALDVTDGDAAEKAVRTAHERFGRLDVVVNNAGYGHFGAVEETSDGELRAQMEANFFAPVTITRAALPFLRERGSGQVVQVSSLGGIGAFANLGAYHASKWALEAISESLYREVADLGIRVTIVEPGGFATDWAGPSARRSAALDAYEPMRAAAAARRGAAVPGDPAAAARALLEIVDAPEPPLRVLFGAQAPGIVAGIYEQRIATWREWEGTSRRAQGE